MYRGFVLRVRPSEEQILCLPFQINAYKVSKKCSENKNAKESNVHTQCVCRCCCFTFEIHDEAEVMKVPSELWGQRVAWRILQNPIGIDQKVDTADAEKILGCSTVGDQEKFFPSRIPGLAHRRMQVYSGTIYDQKEFLIHLSTKKIEQYTSSEKYREISNSHGNVPRLVIMGCGGTGCEILKTLFLRGFHSFTVIDRDTIDMSNLNRQLLFSTQDIGKGKSLVSINRLQDAISRSLFYKSITSTANSLRAYMNELRFFHGNIEDFYQIDDSVPTFSVYEKCSTPHKNAKNMISNALCYSALDNIPTRQYINRLSYFMGKPIIESGVSGLDGQVQPICVDCENQCYDCLGIKSAEQGNSFAVCTIHANPTKLVHCVHYAQELYSFITEVLQKEENNEERAVGEFDELTWIVRKALHDCSHNNENLCTAIKELFNFMCSERILKRYHTAIETPKDESHSEAVGNKRKRSESGYPTESTDTTPKVFDFSQFVSDVSKNHCISSDKSSPLDSLIHRRMALVLYILSISAIFGILPSVGDSSNGKKIKASFIYAITFFRCMVFRIPMEASDENSSALVDPFKVNAHAVDVIQGINTHGKLHSRQSFNDFMCFFEQTNAYLRDPLYRHIESISMKIIPSVSSANAMIGAFAVSMGTKSLLHLHCQGKVFYSNGTQSSIHSEAASGGEHLCTGDYLRHVYVRAKPLQLRERLLASSTSKSQRITHQMPIYSHALFRSKASCPTCASYHPPAKSYSVLADVTCMSICTFRQLVLDNFMSLKFPIIDMLISNGNSVKKELRTLYEEDEFDQNDSECLSKWMDLRSASSLHLIISSTENSDARIKVDVYHDSEKKLPTGSVIIRCFEAPRWNPRSDKKMLA